MRNIETRRINLMKDMFGPLKKIENAKLQGDSTKILLLISHKCGAMSTIAKRHEES